MKNNGFPNGMSLREMKDAGCDTERYLNVNFVPMLTPTNRSPIRRIPDCDEVAVVGAAFVNLCEYPIPKDEGKFKRVEKTRELRFPGYIIANYDDVEYLVNDAAFRKYKEYSYWMIRIHLPIPLDFDFKRYAQIHKKTLSEPIAVLK